MSRDAEDGLPQFIDGLAFARGGSEVAGVVSVAALPRLLELLATDGGRLDCRISGSRDDEGNSWLAMEVSGSLVLECQRCMKALTFSVDVQSQLLLVPQGQPWPDDELTDDRFDAVAADKEMALLPLIEDEVLLALPIVPRHGVCETALPVVDEQEPSPFAVLAKLKKGV